MNRIDEYPNNSLIAIRGELRASVSMPSAHDPIYDELVREGCSDDGNTEETFRIALFEWSPDSAEDLPEAYRPPPGYSHQPDEITKTRDAIDAYTATQHGVGIEVTVVGRVLVGEDLAPEWHRAAALETHGPNYGAFAHRPYKFEMLYLTIKDFVPLPEDNQ